jgi:SET domain-containing protein
VKASSSASSLKKTINDRDKLELREVPGKGRGVFARTPFAKGDEVLEFFGKRVDRDELDDLMHALQVGPRTFLTASGDIDDYVNHSCDPNTGIRDDAAGRVTLFALSALEVGDEITFDYATTQANGFSTMECGCGAEQCRKTIADWKDIPAAKRKRYLAQGAVLSFLK